LSAGASLNAPGLLTCFKAAPSAAVRNGEIEVATSLVEERVVEAL
jgi:hypothetical protein